MPCRSGGGTYYIDSVIKGLKEFSGFEIVVYVEGPENEKDNSISPPVHSNLSGKAWKHAVNTAKFLSQSTGCRMPVLKWEHLSAGVRPDILISQSSLFGFYTGVPFIGFVGDVMFKYFPDLSEYSIVKRLLRNLSTKRLVEKSVYTVVDSERSKKDLIRFYNVQPERIISVPLCAPPHVYAGRNMSAFQSDEILSKFDLPPEYIFYPAQFWEHKNHIRLVDALRFLRKEYGKIIPAVFAGSTSWDNFGNVTDAIKKYDMTEQVLCLGYVQDMEVIALYKKSRALVYPSFAEYTNIPVMEAMVLGTPVICSNSFAMPEQVGDAGVLFDPYDVKDMAEKILSVWEGRNLRNKLVKLGTERAKELSFENFSKNWISLLEQALCDGKKQTIS